MRILEWQRDLLGSLILRCALQNNAKIRNTVHCWSTFWKVRLLGTPRNCRICTSVQKIHGHVRKMTMKTRCSGKMQASSMRCLGGIIQVPISDGKRKCDTGNVGLCWRRAYVRHARRRKQFSFFSLSFFTSQFEPLSEARPWLFALGLHGAISGTCVCRRGQEPGGRGSCLP